MKKYPVFLACCLIMLFAAANAHAQFGGFTGPASTGYTGQQAGFAYPQGFTGPAMTFSVAQLQTFADKTQALLRGNIVSFLGGDLYLFRDSSGEIVVKIKEDRWWGLSVGPNDLVELGGELKRDKKTQLINHFDAKVVRKAL